MNVKDLDGIKELVPADYARSFLKGLGAQISHQKIWGTWRRQVGLVGSNGPTKARYLTQRQFFLMLIRLRYKDLCLEYGIEIREGKNIDAFHLEDLGDLWLARHPGGGPEDAILRLLENNGGTIPANQIGEVLAAWTGKKRSRSTIYRKQRKAGVKPSQSKRKKLTIAQIYKISQV